MKLKTFLQEGIESTKGWEIISTFGNDDQEIIKIIFDGLKKLKRVDELIELKDEDHRRIEFLFSDGMVNVSFIIALGEKKDSNQFEVSFVMVSAKVDTKLLLQLKDNNPDLVYFSVHNMTKQNEAIEKLKIFNSAIEDFTDWYFDLTGQYGKVKLFKTRFDIIDGLHDSKKPRFVALAGDFHITDEIGGAKPVQIEPRVL